MTAYSVCPPRRGVALLVVVFLMAVSAALTLAANDQVLSDLAAVITVTERDRTIVAAEAELWRTLRGLDARLMRNAPVGRVLASRSMTGDIALTSSVEKADTTNVWIVATATIRTGGNLARHRIGMSVRIPTDSADSMLVPLRDRAWADLF